MGRGNCLLGALWLMWKFGTWRLRLKWRRRQVPHFYVVAADGRKYHFMWAKDVLPYPLTYLWFRGVFGEMD